MKQIFVVVLRLKNQLPRRQAGIEPTFKRLQGRGGTNQTQNKRNFFFAFTQSELIKPISPQAAQLVFLLTLSSFHKDGPP